MNLGHTQLDSLVQISAIIAITASGSEERNQRCVKYTGNTITRTKAAMPKKK